MVHPTAWLTEHTSTPRHEAHALVRQSRLVRKHDRTAKALASGDVTVGHLDLLSRAAGHGRDALYTEGEGVLLDAAAKNAVGAFRVVARRWVALADEQLARRDAW